MTYKQIIESQLYKRLNTSNKAITFDFMRNNINFFKDTLLIDYNSFVMKKPNEYSRKFFEINSFLINNYDALLNTSEQEFIEESFETISLIIKYCITRTILTKIVENEKKSKISVDSIEQIIKKDDESSNINWFRGQSNSKWSLFPSFFRNIENCLKNKYGKPIPTVNIDYDYIVEDYKEKLLYKKYETILGSSFYYEALAYMQHSVSYSPLLDFSDSCAIATRFALSNKSQFNNYFYENSTVYGFEVNKWSKYHVDQCFDQLYTSPVVYKVNSLNAINDIIENIKLTYVDTLQVGCCPKTNKLLTIEEFINILTPDIILIDVSVNDRMRYQQGKFVLFNNCVILKEQIFYQLNSNIKFIKYEIEHSSKESLLKKIKDGHEMYSINNMLDPYK